MTESPMRSLLLLSLDGGGVRGLSSLLILQRIMSGVNKKRAPSRPLEPWQVFDLIGGTSTGGIIAIMLGRLEMELSHCIEAYQEMSKEIFTPKRNDMNIFGHLMDGFQAKSRYDAKYLEEAIKRYISKSGVKNKNALLRAPELSCKVCVTAVRQFNTEEVILRSYDNDDRPDETFDKCEIWEAGRATSAAPTCFDPIQLGSFKQWLIDGALRCNNPVNIVYNEAQDLWPDREICIVSIGTGHADPESFEGNLIRITKGLKYLATDSEKPAKTFERGHRELLRNGLYFRFNVSHGLSKVRLQDFQKMAEIAGATAQYLNDDDICKRLLESVDKISANIDADQESRFAAETTVSTGSSSDSTLTLSLSQISNIKFIDAAKSGKTVLLIIDVQNDSTRTQLSTESLNTALIELYENAMHAEQRVKAITIILQRCSPNFNYRNNRNDCTLLMYAAVHGHASVADILIHKGASLKAVDRPYKRTPLLWAARHGQENVIDVLLQNTQDQEAIDAKDMDGNTALVLAYKNKHIRAATKLLHRGANPNVNIEPSLSLLVAAVKAKDETFVRLLIEKDANVNCLNTKLVPLLSVAVYAGSLAIVQLLIRKGANIDATEPEELRTPLMFAIQYRQEKIVELLLKEGADRHKEDISRWSAQGWAKRTRDPRLISLVCQ